MHPPFSSLHKNFNQAGIIVAILPMSISRLRDMSLTANHTARYVLILILVFELGSHSAIFTPEISVLQIKHNLNATERTRIDKAF